MGELVEAQQKYFKDLLNIKHEEEYGETTYLGAYLQVEDPTMKKPLEAINKLKKTQKHQTLGTYIAEFLKYGEETPHGQLYKLITQIWNEEEIPKK